MRKKSLNTYYRGRWGGGQFSFEILYPGYRALNKILSARLEELKKYIQPDIHVIILNREKLNGVSPVIEGF
ncbi:unnamed protein product [Rhizophagus irregularis]|nr:unnamed protein product [Rhizophagus irregularis]